MKMRRLLCLFAALALVAAACGDDEEAPETTSAPAPETTAAAAPETTAAPEVMEEEPEVMEEDPEVMEEEPEEPEEPEEMEEEEEMEEPEPEPMGATYRLGIFSAPTTDNPWAALDTEAEIWNFYVIPGQVSLYTYQGPTYTVVPALAVDISPPQVVADGDGYSVTVNLRSGRHLVGRLSHNGP